MNRKFILGVLLLASFYALGSAILPSVPLNSGTKLLQGYIVIGCWLAYVALGFPETFKKVEEALISGLLAATTLLVFYEVVMRYVFNTGVSWIQEATLLASGAMVLLGMSYGIKVGSHIGVDAFVRLLNSDGRRWVTLIGVLLCLLYCALFLSGGWVYTSKLFKIGIEMQDIPLPKWAAFSVLMIGFALLVTRFTELLVSLAKGEADSFSLADEAKEALEMVGNTSVGSAEAKESRA
ncbi:MAG: TRAP transporter small permease [Rhodospirillum sp.]|nr:TRAP transporter small permease [Rhodospirillum sp.]MCF8487838.1 TRAP transporter small permease [Rhodospirillum sp.]MCF8502630.1 TRAP transporter small permease [Rhodospirillum sp.]